MGSKLKRYTSSYLAYMKRKAELHFHNLTSHVVLTDKIDQQRSYTNTILNLQSNFSVSICLVGSTAPTHSYVAPSMSP